MRSSFVFFLFFLAVAGNFFLPPTPPPSSSSSDSEGSVSPTRDMASPKMDDDVAVVREASPTSSSSSSSSANRQSINSPLISFQPVSVPFKSFESNKIKKKKCSTMRAEGIDWNAAVDRGGEAHALGRRLSGAVAAAAHQSRGEVAQKDSPQNQEQGAFRPSLFFFFFLRFSRLPAFPRLFQSFDGA